MRERFPLFRSHPGLVYLDYANTAPKPDVVIEAVTEYYRDYSANVHRANYGIGVQAEDAYEGARDRIAEWFACQSDQVVVTKGTTEALNLVAQSWAKPRLRTGDEILVTGLEHHANLVPWQMVARETGATLRVAPLDQQGGFHLESWSGMLGEATKICAFPHVSNVTGECLPVALMAEMARKCGTVTVVDAAQSVPHQRIKFADIGADFVAFSGHKAYGPTGVGNLIGRQELLAEMAPWHGGGDMIEDVWYDHATFKAPPMRFEAGTPPIAAMIGLGAAFSFLDEALTTSREEVERILMRELKAGLLQLNGLQMIGPDLDETRLVTFVVAGVHATDLGAYLAEKEIAVRVGKHCAHPLLRTLGADSAVRISIGLATTADDISRVLESLQKGMRLLRS